MTDRQTDIELLFVVRTITVKIFKKTYTMYKKSLHWRPAQRPKPLTGRPP